MAELADIVEEINALNIHEGEDKEIEAELNISKKCCCNLWRLFIWQNNFFRAMMTQMVQWR